MSHFKKPNFRAGRMSSTLVTSCTISRGTEEEIQVTFIMIIWWNFAGIDDGDI